MKYNRRCLNDSTAPGYRSQLCSGPGVTAARARSWNDRWSGCHVTPWQAQLVPGVASPASFAQPAASASWSQRRRASPCGGRGRVRSLKSALLRLDTGACHRGERFLHQNGSVGPVCDSPNVLKLVPTVPSQCSHAQPAPSALQ